MSEPAALSAEALAQAKLRARAARISRMRRRVVAASLATFALAFGVVAVDGSMGTSTSATRTQTSASATTAVGRSSSWSSDGTTTSDDSSSSDDSLSSSAAASPSAVTTSQS